MIHFTGGLVSENTNKSLTTEYFITLSKSKQVEFQGLQNFNRTALLHLLAAGPLTYTQFSKPSLNIDRIFFLIIP